MGRCVPWPAPTGPVTTDGAGGLDTQESHPRTDSTQGGAPGVVRIHCPQTGAQQALGEHWLWLTHLIPSVESCPFTSMGQANKTCLLGPLAPLGSSLCETEISPVPSTCPVPTGGLKPKAWNSHQGRCWHTSPKACGQGLAGDSWPSAQLHPYLPHVREHLCPSFSSLCNSVIITCPGDSGAPDARKKPHPGSSTRRPRHSPCPGPAHRGPAARYQMGKWTQTPPAGGRPGAAGTPASLQTPFAATRAVVKAMSVNPGPPHSLSQGPLPSPMMGSQLLGKREQARGPGQPRENSSKPALPRRGATSHMW